MQRIIMGGEMHPAPHLLPLTFQILPLTSTRVLHHMSRNLSPIISHLSFLLPHLSPLVSHLSPLTAPTEREEARPYDPRQDAQKGHGGEITLEFNRIER